MSNELPTENWVNEQTPIKNNTGRWVLLGVVILQWLLFRAYVDREVSWSPFLNGDANAYLGHSYIVFDSLINGRGIPDEFRFGPHGIGPLLLSAFMYLLFGASRLIALTPNLLFFILLQLVTYTSVRRISGSVKIALTAVGFLLCLRIPFQSNPMLFLNITEYQREFLVFSLFGIMIWYAVLSNGFKTLSYSLLAGLAAGIAVVFRYVTLFHIVGVFGSFAAILMASVSWQVLRNRKRWADYFPQIKNFLGSASVFFAVTIYPLFLARHALFGHYFSGTISGPQDKDFIALYQQGVKTFFEQVIFYPYAVINVFIGETFFVLSITTLLILMLFAVIALVQGKPISKSDVFGIPYRIDRTPAYVFCFIAIIVPLALLTFYPTRSAQMGVVVVPPLVIALFLLIVDAYKLGLKHFTGCIGYVSGTGIALALLSAGLIFQIKAYSMVGLSSVARQHYLEVARLYDDIGRLAKKLGTNTPTISTDFLENYTIDCGSAIIAYHYEKEREILRPRCIVPSDVGTVYTYEGARNDMLGSNLLILSLEETSLDAWNPYARDPLSQILASYPFPRSITPFRKQLHVDLQKDYKLIDVYQIFNRKVGLFLRPQPPVPVSVHTTSIGGPGTPASTLFSEGDTVWHSESPPKFPVTIEFEYEKPEKLSALMLFPQIGNKTRVPSNFVLQGMSAKGEWINLLNVKGAKTDDDGAPIRLQLAGNAAYKSYRMIIFANGGSPGFVTLRRIIPSFIPTDQPVSLSSKK